MLVHERYTESCVGSGTPVSTVLSEALSSAREVAPRKHSQGVARKARAHYRFVANLGTMRQRSAVGQRVFCPDLGEKLEQVKYKRQQ